MTNEKNPWVAAILNLLLLGAGYIYNGKRIFVGILFILFAVTVFFDAVLPSPEFSESLLSQYSASLTSNDLYILTIRGFLEFFYYLIPIALAYDAYKEAQEINQANRGKKK